MTFFNDKLELRDVNLQNYEFITSKLQISENVWPFSSELRVYIAHNFFWKKIDFLPHNLQHVNSEQNSMFTSRIAIITFSPQNV